MTGRPIIGINTEANLLSHILSINNVLQQEKGIGALKADSPDVRALTEKLHITQIQAVLFSIVLNIQDDESVSMTEIAESVKTSTLMIQQYSNDFDVLVEKRLLRKYQSFPSRRGAYAARSGNTTSTFRVTKDVVDALNNNEEWNPPANTGLTFEDFFETLDSLFEQRIGEDICLDTLKFEITHLLKDNNHLDFLKLIRDLSLSEEDTILLLVFCNQAIDNDQKISQHTISDIFDYRGRRIWREITNEKNSLQKLSLIENAGLEGLGDDKYFSLTQKAKDDLIGIEITTTSTSGKKPRGWLSWKDIKPKELIYNETEKDKIATLQKLLDKNHFQDVITRLESSNMRLGFGCLFSGAAGVGKTETALQIARLTERDIVKVDICSVKSKWFGESQKLIKDVFERYRGLVKSAKANKENIPILFFNEADAVFSRRQGIGEEHNGPAQTENAIQNIILDELENLDGILIATTNLTKNFDDAFERRFLYKIDFSKPDKESRKAIWKSMIGDLSDDDAGVLAAEYDFSGGEIENIARKRAIDLVIKGETPNLEEVMSLCRDEKLVKEAGAKIGFDL